VHATGEALAVAHENPPGHGMQFTDPVMVV
jgi:hypothetical protein